MSPPEPEYRPQHLRSNANSDDDDDDDDETPLAAQLAEVLAAQGAEEAAVLAASCRSSPTPLAPAGLPAPRVPSDSSRPLSAVAQLPAHSQQRRMSDIAQVRPELMGAPSQTVSSLVLPSKPISKSPMTPGVAFAGESPTGVAHHGPLRTPSPAASGAMTAKKSGYSSYWSVHERSAFMHYVARLGPDWAAIAEAIGSKTATQARNYFRTNREKLKLDVVLAEYERNKAAGTVPPMAPYVVPGSSSTHPAGASADAAGAAPRKEKRGRKRKTESRTSPAVPENMPLAMSLAVNQPHHAQPIAAQPITAPATLTSIPTIGIDGGRAVVVARPSVAVPPPPFAQDGPRSAGVTKAQRYPPSQIQTAHTFHHQPPASIGQSHPTRPMWATQQQQQPQQQQAQQQPRPSPIAPSYAPSQQQPHQPAYSLPPLMVRGHDMPDRLPVVTHRGDSDTPSSQPTPPPVDGLPRFSSSPAPPVHQRPRISSPLPRINATRTYSPASLPPHPHSALNIASITNSEPRKMSVTKINALLNDDEPPPPTSKWQEPASAPPKPAVSNDDEATGMAALALASMMEAGRPASSKPQQQPLPPSSNRPIEPVPPHIPAGTSHISNSQPIQSSPISAFQPVHSRSPPIVSPRPASAGPTAFQPRLASPAHPYPTHQQPPVQMYQPAPPRTSAGYIPPPPGHPMGSEGRQQTTVLPPIMTHSSPPPPQPQPTPHIPVQQHQQRVIGQSPQVSQMHGQMPSRQPAYLPPASLPQTYPMSAPSHTPAPPAHSHFYMQQPPPPSQQQQHQRMPVMHQRSPIGHPQAPPPLHQQRYPPPQPPQQPYDDLQRYPDQQRPR
ncbi:hypothetical protein DL89DRAFT_24295 [Linderina pennispora]|uniref:Uncharacterized protein n=1 Tax=Linderina pennispora TaxID=61395 RepID=A0A1Y1WNG9_9FUNG|nr:uncharacterized protein DL89DRAFT_24295 [Linderina pennispora]ORX74915.1 hypothetical protein DL89DRAFT_24295 [Linderina pennispora]